MTKVPLHSEELKALYRGIYAKADKILSKVLILMFLFWNSYCHFLRNMVGCDWRRRIMSPGLFHNQETLARTHYLPIYT